MRLLNCPKLHIDEFGIVHYRSHQSPTDRALMETPPMSKYLEHLVEAVAAAVLVAGATYIILFNGAVLL